MGHCCSECNSQNITLDNPSQRKIQLGNRSRVYFFWLAFSKILIF